MICGKWETGEHFNYEFVEGDMVKLWNPTTDPILILYKEWIKYYYVRDKWGSI